MKAEELMVGDWVIHPDLGALKVGIINNWNDTVWNDDNISGNMSPIQELRPIPLTAEILEKNGFKKGGYTNLSPDYYLETKEYCVQVNLHHTPDKRDFLSVYSNNNPNSEVISYGCRETAEWYAHKLQQLLRICGLLELANNFKI